MRLRIRVVKGLAALGAGLLLGIVGVASPAEAKRPADPVTPNIVGGSTAAAGEFPWMVELSTPAGDCGGTLLTTRIVLTAGHCVTGTGDDTSITATLGVVDLLSPSRIIRHSIYVYRAPDYAYASNYVNNDWALVKLDNSVNLPTLRIAPHGGYDNGTFTIAGWGSTYYGGTLQRYLRKAQVPFVNDSSCGQSYPGRIVASNMICAGYSQGGIDTCQGDSGGPLFRYDENNQWVQVGITSWGDGCAQPNKPGVYTQLSTYSAAILAVAADLTNPISAYLSGPGFIAAKSTYTYTTVHSGFVYPTFSWYERFCYDSNCPAWYYLYDSTSASINRVLSPDCSGTGANSFEVRVVVHNSDGRTVDTNLTTSLCQNEPF